MVFTYRISEIEISLPKTSRVLILDGDGEVHVIMELGSGVVGVVLGPLRDVS